MRLSGSSLNSASLSAAAVLTGWVFLCAFDLPQPGAGLPAKVQEVIDRTKTTHVTYALYNWNRMAGPNGMQEEWSAEFHSGDLHRVETPRDRVVANCQANTGSGLSLATGKTVSGAEWARSACGINTNRQFLDAEWLGVFPTRFGNADRIRLTDKDNIRTYNVRDDGVIVSTVYARNSPQMQVVLVSYGVEIKPELPEKDIFSEASLLKGAVPERYRVAPAP